MKRLIFSLVFFAIASVSFGQNIKLNRNLFPGSKIDSVNRVELSGYEILLNQTRDSAGVVNLVRKAELDKYCYERCIRLAKIFLEDPANYYLSFGEGGRSSTFHNEAHEKREKMENADNVFTGSISYSAGGINNRCNKYLGHYRNRVNPKWKNYGSCTIVISYKPSALSSEVRLPGKFIISYEAFE